MGYTLRIFSLSCLNSETHHFAIFKARIFCHRYLSKASVKARAMVFVHIFCEGHKILRNLHLTFDCSTYSQKLGEDFAKFYGLLRIYEL